jgi:hypothetical protein
MRQLLRRLEEGKAGDRAALAILRATLKAELRGPSEVDQVIDVFSRHRTDEEGFVREAAALDILPRHGTRPMQELDLHYLWQQIAVERPLEDDELRQLGKANSWAMDWESDGGTLPPEVARVADIPDPGRGQGKREKTPAQVRVLLAWYHRTAPGNY